MIQNFRREFQEQDLGCVIEKLKIGVFSVGRGAGSTFVATSIAAYLAMEKRMAVAFVDISMPESGKSILYDELGMGHRFAHRNFTQFFTEVSNRRYIRPLTNTEAGINWSIPTSQEIKEGLTITALEESRLINNIQGDVIICDLGYNLRRDTLDEMDLYVGVIDPMPSIMMAGQSVYQKMKKLECEGRKVVWVINRQNGGVLKKQFKQQMKLKAPTVLPLINGEWFYTAQYNCKIPFEQPEIRKLVFSQIEELVSHHILVT